MLDPWMSTTQVTDFSDGDVTVTVYGTDGSVVASEDATIFTFELSAESTGFLYPEGANMDAIQSTGYDQTLILVYSIRRCRKCSN